MESKGEKTAEVEGREQTTGERKGRRKQERGIN